MKLPPDIGISTSIDYTGPLGDVLERIAAYAELAEVYSDGAHDLLDPVHQRIARESGLRLTVHGPFEKLDPGSLDEAERRRSVEVHRRHLEAATEVGALLYIVHPDWTPSPRDRDQRVIEALSRTIADLGRLQAQTGTTVVMENMPGPGQSHFLAPGDLDLGELGLILDVGHAAIDGVLDDFLADPRARLRHVHLHDNRGPVDVEDPHLALGRGVVDAAAVLAVARASGATVILELMSEDDVLESIAHLERRGLI